MNRDAPGPGGGGAQPTSADFAARIARLEIAQRRLRIDLWFAIACFLGALILLLVVIERRHLAWRADTIYAHRFVLEHEGATRAELSMHPAGWPQLLLEPDRRQQPGVAIAGRGELVIRGGGGWMTDIRGATVHMFGPGDQMATMLEQGPGGYVAWIWYDDAGRRVMTLRKPGEKFRRIMMDPADTLGPVVRPR